MNNDENRRNSSDIKASLDDFIALISEHPGLALPLGAVIGLFGLATVFKTFIDGFNWAYSGWGIHGVVLVVMGVVIMSSVATWILRAAVAPRPVIQPFPAQLLSRTPIVKWEYREGDPRRTSYELRVKLLTTRKKVSIPVPERMHQIAIADITGEDITGAMEVSVDAVVAGRKIRGSRPVRTEIYRDSVQRIQRTGRVRVAVHTDPAEEIFCFLRNGRWQGFDIDLATLIASELQQDPDIGRPIEVEYCFYEWPAVISAPTEHEVDFAIASISISEDRAKKYGIVFSAPYAESRLGVVAYRPALAMSEVEESIGLDALKGKTIAVHDETTALASLKKAVEDARYSNINIVVAASNDELRERLRDNNVDAVVYDYQRAFTLLEAGTVIYALDLDAHLQRDEYGIAFSRVNAALLRKVDAVIKKHPLRLATTLTRRIQAKRRAILQEATVAQSANSQRATESASTNLFVYGSLMYGQVWRRLINGEFQRKSAQLSGYRRLKIRSQDYPGLIQGVGVVHGILWLELDELSLRRLDRFEADCYQRTSGVVVDDDGKEIPADFFELRESHRSIIEDVEWDAQEFERKGLSRFIDNYAGFSE